MAFYLISIIFILSFTKGTLEELGLDPVTLLLSIDVLILIVFLYSLLNVTKTKFFKGPVLIIPVLLLFIVLVSFLLSDVPEIQMLLFIRRLGLYFLFFYALFNLNLSDFDKKSLFKLIIFLFIVQIPAAFIKLLIMGTMEDYIGMISINQGSLATTMPLLAISYLIAQQLEYQRTFTRLVWILLFIGVGVISLKIGILYYVIILYLALTYVFARRHSDSVYINTLFLRKMLVTSVILSMIFMAYVSLNPRTNPEHEVGGSVDIEYLAEFTADYQTVKFKGSRLEGDGRFDAPGVAYDRLKDGGWVNLLFGFGAGELIKSSYAEHKNAMAEKYRIGYGGRVGAVWLMLQIGFVGLIVFASFHLVLMKKIWNVYFHQDISKEFQMITLATFGFSILFFLDFFTYSYGMIHNPAMAITYYFAIYYVLSGERNRVVT